MSGSHQQALERKVSDITRRSGIWLGLVPMIAIALCGCRAPWHRTPSGEPSFDRLLEIEQADAKDPRGDFQVQRRRPGGRSYQPGQASELASVEAHLDDASSPGEEDELFAEEMQNGQVSEILQLTRLAVENRKRASTGRPESRSRTPASGSINDVAASPQTPSDALDDDSAVAFKMNDQGTFESAPLNETTTQLADNRVSSRRQTDSAVRTAAYSADPEDDVQTASASRSIADQRDEDDRSGHLEDDMTWEEHVRAAIRGLEQTADASLSPQTQIRRATIARLLSTTIGDLDAAMEPIEGLKPDEQDYFRYQFKALSDSIDPDGNPVASRRWSLAMLSQRKSLEHLAAVSNLEVANAAFCTEVESFGVVTKFGEYQFKPDQELLLYCELDNFVSESVKAGYETQLQGSYEIVDSNGRRVADQLLPMDSHTCRNRRRDYFIAYRIYMPQNVSKGRYTLKLTIEDMKGRKFGQSELDFEIVD